MKLRRLAIILSVVAAATLVIGGLAALLLPRIVDSQLIKNRISDQLSKRFAGRIMTGKIELSWFPRPIVVIHDARLTFGNDDWASIPAVKIYPSLIDLFMTRFIARTVILIEPQLLLRLPERSEKPWDLEELEKQISAAVAHFTRTIPVRAIDLTDGSAEIRIGNEAAVHLQNLTGQAISSPEELRLEISGRSSLWDQLRLKAKLLPEHLSSQVDLAVVRLRIDELLPFLPIAAFMSDGSASFEAKIAFIGLRQVKATIDGSAGPVTLSRQDRTAKIQIERVKSALVYAGGDLQIDITELDLGSPRLKAAGQIKFGSNAASANIKVRNVDIAEVSDLALRLIDSKEDIVEIRRYLRAGVLSEINLESAGHSPADLILSKNIVFRGLLREGKVFVPGPELELVNATGAVRFAADGLDANDIKADLGTMKISNGRLKFGFRGRASPFHLDLSIQTGAPELRAVLVKLVRDEAFREALLKIRELEGELSGRLVLGGTMDAIVPMIAVSKADIRATYAPLPFPITIKDGRLDYDGKMIRLESGQGSLGRSNFVGLRAALRHDGSRQIKIDSKRVSLDLQQADVLLRNNFANMRAQAEKLPSMYGQVELHNATLAGAYDDPSRWTFASTGTLTQVEIRHEDFPDRVRLPRGKFEANEHRILFSDALATILDASFSIGGRVEYELSALTQMDVSGTGTLGARMTQWLSGYADLPEQLSLRSPLDIATTRLTWQAAGDISLHGQATVAGGPRLSVDAVKKPQGLAIPLLSIDDGDRHARFAMQLADGNVDLSFNGELTSEMLDRVFAAFPVKGSSLRGDIQVTATRAEPIRFSGRGEISGNDLWIPLGREQALIEKVSIEAHPDGIVIQSADLRWPKSRLAASGKITPGKRALQLDLDVRGDQVDWQELQESFGGDAMQPKQNRADTKSFPDIEGTIRLKTERFAFERFNLSPLETTVNFSPSGINADIDRGDVCGITAKGRVEIVNAEIGIDLQLSAKDASLEPSTVCLTNQQNDIKGVYSLTARLAGRGNRRELLRALKGNFELSARNGEFIRSPGIDATFDYLNATGDFKVPFPDLDRETFPYRSLGVKGRIEGNLVIADEVVIDSTLLNLSGQAKVDLERKQIDGKGLIAVLKPVDKVIRRLPVINSLLGRTLVGIPVRITGSLDGPAITYLSPTDVGAELLNIPLRILGMPLGALRLFTPNKDTKDNGK